MRALALACFGMTILIPGAGAETRDKPATSATASTIRTGSTNVALTPRAAVSYAVLAAAGDDLKRSFAVQLERRVTDADLKLIAAEIRHADAATAATAVIMFYLPGMKIGHGVWAHAYFAAARGTPDAHDASDGKVTIVGLTVAEAERLIQDARRDSRNLIGAWLTATPAPVGKLTLYREKGRLFAEWGLRDGRRFAEEFVETALPEGSWRYDRRVGGAADHMHVTATGELELRDRDNSTTTTELIKREPGDFNLAIAYSNQVKLSEGKGGSKVDARKLADVNKFSDTASVVTVGSGTTTAGSLSNVSTTDKPAKTNTALPAKPAADANALANVIFR